MLRPATLKQTPAWLNEPLEDWLAARALELCYTNEELRPFALELGRSHPPFRWQPERRVLLQAEIDAAMLHLYGLNRLQAEWLIDSFAVLRKYEERDFGELRTKQIILEIFDQLDAAKNVGSKYLTRLSPPPADASCCQESQVDTAPDTSEVYTRQWEHNIRDEIDVRLLLAAIVKRMRQPRPLRDVVHAFLFAARPNLLMAHLDADRQAEWRRLVGNAVDLQPTTGVVSFSSAHLGRFTEARTRLAADGAWRFDVETGAVDRGAPIYSIALPAWAEGRADFVWHAMRSISQESAMTALSQEEQTFLAQAAAA